MSETKWTPGPWVITTNFDYWVQTEDDEPIAECGSIDWDGWQEKQAEWEANAHLIAAAPELYEACKYIVDAGDSGDEMLAIEKATAALAKARGE